MYILYILERERYGDIIKTGNKKTHHLWQELHKPVRERRNTSGTLKWSSPAQPLHPPWRNHVYLPQHVHPAEIKVTNILSKMSTCYSTFSTNHPPRCFHKLANGTESPLKLLLLSQGFQPSLRIKTEAIRWWPDHEKLCLSNAFCKPRVVLGPEEDTWYLNS